MTRTAPYLLLYLISLAIRVAALPDAFDTADKIFHPFPAMNLFHLPWITPNLRHSKIGAFLTYPYGIVLIFYYGWFSFLNAIHVPITEFTIGLLCALLGSFVPVVFFKILQRYFSISVSLTLSFIVAFWHAHLLRSTSPYSIVLTLGLLGILVVSHFLITYLDNPNKNNARNLALSIFGHFLSCQTAILFGPVWLFFVLRSKKSILDLWKNGLVKTFLFCFGSLVIIYLCSWKALNNPYVTVIGKLFSKGGHESFDPLQVLLDYRKGIGWLSTLIVFLSFIWGTWSLAKKKKNLLVVLLLALGIFYSVPLLFLSKATVVSAYAYESQSIFFLLAVILSGLNRYRHFLIPTLFLLVTFETVTSFVLKWPTHMPNLGIERDYSLNPRIDIKAAGFLLRDKYPNSNLKVVSDVEPVLANYYFGNRSIFSTYDSTQYQDIELLRYALTHNLADIAIFDETTVNHSRLGQLIKTRCIRWKVGNKVFLELDTKHRCAQMDVSAIEYAKGFNETYNTVEQIHPKWVPHPYPQFLPK
ncbi:MAG: hypothetical protein AB7F43_11350 [Bacteriovoracia bacterium]